MSRTGRSGGANVVQEQPSALMLYVARRLSHLTTRPAKVLDLGCGEGRLLKFLAGRGYDLYGCDFPDRLELARAQLGHRFDGSLAERLRPSLDARSIPFDSACFDAVCALQVFEHVTYLDQILRECARVLKPDGVLIATLPLATSPIELHIGVPFAHWLPPGRARIAYLRAMAAGGLLRRRAGESSLDAARKADTYLQNETFYRFANELSALGASSFGECYLDTEALLTTKLQIMARSGHLPGSLLSASLRLAGPRRLAPIVTHGIIAAMVMRTPRVTGGQGVPRA